MENSVAGTAANDNTPAGTAGVLQWIQPPHPWKIVKELENRTWEENWLWNTRLPYSSTVEVQSTVILFETFLYRLGTCDTVCHILRSSSASCHFKSFAAIRTAGKEKGGRDKMRVQTEMISWAAEIGERFPPRPVQIPSLLSSAESKMQLTGKEDAIDSPLSLLFMSSPSFSPEGAIYSPCSHSTHWCM